VTKVTSLAITSRNDGIRGLNARSLFLLLLIACLSPFAGPAAARVPTAKPIKIGVSRSPVRSGPVDYSVNAHASIGVYYGHAAGKLIVQSIYPNGKNANFGNLEFTFRM
jgi:hypothetical protein